MEEIWKGLSGGERLTVNAGMSANKLLSTFVKYSMPVSSSARSKKVGGRRRLALIYFHAHLCFYI